MGTHGPAPATHGPSPKPRSVDEEQVRLMLQVQTLLSAKCIDEDELKKAEKQKHKLSEKQPGLERGRWHSKVADRHDCF